MRVHGDVKPPEWTAESCPNKPGTALVRFCLNPVEEEAEERTGWVYDEYTVEVADTPGLLDEVAANYDALLREAKASEKSKTDLVEENEELAAENKLLKAQVQAQTERSDFIEDCIAEMAGVIYAAGET